MTGGRDSGDTLVEVLIATAILGAAVVAGLGIMNFGFGIIMNAIERTQVQAEVTSQISLARYARDSYINSLSGADIGAGGEVWEGVLAGARTNYGPEVCETDGTPNTDASREPFYFSDDGMTREVFNPNNPASAATDLAPQAGRGLWVEAVRESATADYVDIYVKACWVPSAGATVQEAKSVMRLYVPVR